MPKPCQYGGSGIKPVLHGGRTRLGGDWDTRLRPPINLQTVDRLKRLGYSNEDLAERYCRSYDDFVHAVWYERVKQAKRAERLAA